jgi:CHAP domain
MIEITTSMAEALQRAQSLVNQGEYILGTGDYRPREDANGNCIDLPYTQHNGSGPAGADCAGFAVCWCYKVVRHQPGFNHGSWATVSDDINVDSVIEDARHTQEMGTVIKTPVAGAWLLYPTIRDPRNPQPFIGHVAIIESVPAEFDADAPD